MFAIYIPNQRGDAAKLLKTVGAEWALDPVVKPVAAVVAGTGPDGGSGTLVGFEHRDQVNPAVVIRRVLPDRQEWQPAAPDVDGPAGRYWLGVWRQHMPMPEDLQRAHVCDGLPLPLADGNEWIVPVVDNLPKRLKLDRSTGKEFEVPLEEYQRLTDRTREIFEAVMTEDNRTPLARMVDALGVSAMHYATEALAASYRIDINLVDTLGLFGEYEVVEAAMITTGLTLIATAGDLSAMELRELAMHEHGEIGG